MEANELLLYGLDSPYSLISFFFRIPPPPTGQWGARRLTGSYNTRHDIFAPWAGVNEDHLYAHALATPGIVWTGTG